MRTPRSGSLAVLALILLSPRLSEPQSSMCAPVSNNPLVMANLCSPAPAIEKTPAKSPARPPLTLTVEQVDKMVLDSSPLIHPGDLLLFETNRRDFVLHLLLSNGKEIVTQPLTREDAEDTSIAWRQGRIRLDYPEALNERIVRYRLVPLHPEGTPLLIRGIKIDGKGKLIFELEKSIPGAAKPAPIEPPMSYPPDPHVMTASASKPDIWGRQPEPGFLAPHLPSFSIHPMMFQSTTGTGDPNHFKWNGKELDEETGLYNFGARYYSPALGRFVTPDPKIISKQRMRDPQQWNMYSYSRNNPTSMFDPDGKEVTTLLTGQDYKNLVNALAQSYRKESFRSAFKDLKSNPMVHEFGKMKTTYTPVAPGSVVVNANPGATNLLGAEPGTNGNLDFSHAHTEIKVDLDRGDAAHVESHEVEHGVQAQTDPAGYADASTKGAGSPEYDKLDNQAEGFADKVDAEKPTMSLKDATKEVQKLLPEPKPNPKKEDQK